MQISYTNNNESLIDSVNFVNQLSSNEEFWTDIEHHPQFDNTTLSSNEICRRLRACTRAVTLLHWTPRVGRRRTVAVTDPDRPYRIYYHTRFLGNAVAAMVNTLVHEFVHNVDLFDDGSPTNEYTHNGQRAAGNQGTAPYWIGDLAQNHYDNVPLLTEGTSYAELQGFECELVKVADDEIG